MELSRLTATLANAAQRARLLVNGVAGPLTDRQRALASDVLRDVEQLCDAAGAASAHLRVEPEVFSLATLVADVVGTFRFVAHRKQLALTLLGAHGVVDCFADTGIVRTILVDAIGAAVTAAPSGARVSVEMARSGDRIAVDIGAPGWDPRLPPAPPAGSGAALSVLRTAGGARLVVSVPAAV
jgi:signal transduction histidine kinase